MSAGSRSSPRPTDPSGQALEPRDQPGYYPGYSTLGQQRHWDETTRHVVVDRVESTPPIVYFDPDEERFWSLVFDHLIPQSDRTESRFIPIVPAVDHRLAVDRSGGYRYAEMPPDREAYKLGRQAIDEEARALHGAAFLELDYPAREQVLKRIHDAEPAAGAEIWKRMSIHRFWQLITGDAIEAYYAHPWAWDEIGFGGPAYPRGYTRLERGEPEPWEVRERRYEWKPPEECSSRETENVHEFHTEAEQHRSHERRGLLR